MNKRLLLVEDEAIIALNESMFLENSGFDVKTVHSGESAIEIVESTVFDLILMDIDLGSGLDGTETARFILQKNDIPIVFLSSHTESEIVEKTEGITSYGYIVKDTGNTVLLASIKMAFKLQEARKAIQEREKKLLWEKNKFKKYINIAEVMLIVLGLDKKIKLINERGCKTLGYDSEKDIIGRNWFDTFIVDDEKQQVKTVFEEIISSKDSVPEYYENYVVCKEGKKKLIAWRNSILRDENSDIAGVLCSGEDITEQTNLTKELKNSRDDFYQLFSKMKDGAAVFKAVDDGKDFIFTDLNEAGCRMWNVTNDDIIGKNYADVLPVSKDKSLFEALKSVYQSGKPETLPALDYKIKGKELWLDNFIFQLPSGMIVTIFQDQYLFQKLKENEQRFKIINEISSDYSYCHKFKPDGSLEPVWDIGSFTEITGYSPEEMNKLGGLGVLIHQDDLPGASEYIKNLLSGKSASFTARVISKNGEIRWIEDSGKPWFDDESGKVIGAYGFARDITMQKELSEKLVESEKKYRQMYLNAPLPYQSLDNDGCFIDVNPAWLKTLGYARDEVIGRRFSEFLHKDYIEHFEKNFPAFKARGYVHDVQFIIRHKNGEYKEISFEGCIGYKSDGSFSQTYCVFKDITEQKKTERENQLLMKELNHRVKNNLQMVSSLINLKNDELGSICDLNGLKKQIDAILLIHKTLEIDKSVADVQLNSYIGELTKSVFSSNPQFSIEIKVEIPEIRIKTNIAVTIGIIINEIAVNAIKHSFLKDQNSGFSVIGNITDENKKLSLEISFDGVPFPAGINFDNSPGLGLRLIKSLTSQMGGIIQLQKEPATMFSLQIPLQLPE